MGHFHLPPQGGAAGDPPNPSHPAPPSLPPAAGGPLHPPPQLTMQTGQRPLPLGVPGGQPQAGLGGPWGWGWAQVCTDKRSALPAARHPGNGGPQALHMAGTPKLCRGREGGTHSTCAVRMAGPFTRELATRLSGLEKGLHPNRRGLDSCTPEGPPNPVDVGGPREPQIK